MKKTDKLDITPVNQTSNISGIVTGIRVCAIFGLAWWFSALSTYKHFPIVFAVIGVAIALFLLVKARSMLLSAANTKIKLGADYWRIVIMEIVAIIIAVCIGKGTNHSGVIAPLITVIVGLHFVALARLFKQPRYLINGWIMALLGAVLLVIDLVHHHIDGTIRFYDGLMSAGILWSCAYSFIEEAAAERKAAKAKK